MKKNILLFIVLFSLGILVTYPSFVPSHALDSYCTMHNGYNDTAIWFLQNGRLFSALLYYFYSLVNLPFDSMRFVSSFFTNMFLALTILCLYNKTAYNLKNNSKYIKFILLVSLFIMFYTPLFVELLLVDETCVIALGILLVTLSAIKIYDGKLFSYLLGLLFSFLGCLCYQGVMCYLIPLLLVLFISSSTNTDFKVSNILKKTLMALIIYGISFIFNYAIIKIVSSFMHETIGKLGSFDFVYNLKLIITDFMYNSLNNLFGFTNPKIYYLFVIILLAVCVHLISKNDNKKRNIILLSLALLSAIIIPFAPNLFMNSESNYTAARMALTLTIMPSIISIYIICLFEIKNIKYILICLMILIFGFYAYNIHQNTMINFKRFKEDIKYVKNISNHIKWHENETKEKIKTIYYAKDTSVDYYYDFGNSNGANIRLMAVDWSLDCAFPTYTDNKYKIKKMSDEDYNKYFKGKDYKKFSKKQLVFEGDKLYLLLY